MTHANLFLKCHKENLKLGVEKLMEDYSKVYKKQEYFEKGKLSGFIFYDIKEKTCVIIEMCFNTKNNFALLKCLKKVVKNCQEVIFHTEYYNQKLVDFYNKIGAILLKKEGNNLVYLLKFKEKI